MFCEVLLNKRNHKKMLLQVNLLIAGAVCKLDDEVGRLTTGVLLLM